jgi:acyl-CoA dehydrogenase
LSAEKAINGVKTNMVRLRGRAPQGQQLVDKTAHGPWKASTFIAALRHDGVIAPGVFDCAINGDMFLAWVDQVLVHALRPSDIVVMDDNLSSHKSVAAKHAIEAAGVEFRFLPPYRPDPSRSECCSQRSRAAWALYPSAYAIPSDHQGHLCPLPRRRATIHAVSDPIAIWLAACPDPGTDPLPGMAEAGLFDPPADYAALARIKAALVRRTGLLGVASVGGGRHLVYRHFLAAGTDAQRQAWRGKALAVGISEPKVGAHPKLLTTRAEPTAGGFRITGQKAWVTNGPSADAIIVFAITAEDAGRKRYSAFIVPRDTPGITTEDMPGFHALRPSRHCLLTLSGVEVPADARLGEPGTAFERLALTFRDVEDAVGTFGTLGALHYGLAQFAGTPLAEKASDLGAAVALTHVFAAGAEALVARLDAGTLRTGDATLVGLRVLAADLVERLRALAAGLSAETPASIRLRAIIADLDATLGIARGPRLARQTALGEAALRIQIA